jgi:ribosomal protein L37AE/L43A
LDLIGKGVVKMEKLRRYRFYCEDCDKEKFKPDEGTKPPTCDCCGKKMKPQRRLIGDKNGEKSDLGWDDV